MTPLQCLAKRNELLAQARLIDKQGGDNALSGRCRILASNLEHMASPVVGVRERGQKTYDKTRQDLDDYINRRGFYARFDVDGKLKSEAAAV